MSKINRITDTLGFKLTLGTFLEAYIDFTVMDGSTHDKHFASFGFTDIGKDKELVNMYFNKKEVELMRDLFAHAAKYMEEL